MRKGRFRKPIAKSAALYSESVSFDRRFYRHYITGAIAHAAALSKAGIISTVEQKKIQSGLREIEREIASGKFSWDESLEDVHMNIEEALTKKIGECTLNIHMHVFERLVPTEFSRGNLSFDFTQPGLDFFLFDSGNDSRFRERSCVSN